MSRRLQIGLVIAAVLLVRLPLLNQAVQGDDYYYLKGAEHALIDPLHPHHAEYLFLGAKVSMRGHPHPPGNAWVLGGLLALFGDVKEIPFHAAYGLFSLVAAISALVLAWKFSPRPLTAALLFLAAPPFLVNGNSFESDIPFLAFWLAAVAFYVHDRPAWASISAALAALFAYQAILLTPVLFLAPASRRRWIPVVAAPATFLAFQAFERLTSGALPAQVLAGYMQTHEFQSLVRKARNAVALSGHLIFTIVCPIVWLRREPLRDSRFLLAWIAIFFAGALAIFFAGSARYLLPIAAPLAILASTSRFAIPAIAIQAAIGLGLATVNYQHWGAYREIVRQMPKARRTFVNAELGLRHYAEAAGAIPVEKGQAFRSGDLVISTAYSEKIAAPVGLIAEHVINSSIPLRIIGLGVNSAYSSIDFGLMPFAISRSPLDRVRIEKVTRKEPSLSVLTIGSPESLDHALAGISAGDQWTFQEAMFQLKVPVGRYRAFAKFYIPPGATGRRVQLLIDGQIVGELQDVPEGIQTIESSPRVGSGGSATLTIATDRPFRPSNDQRALGVLLTEIGFAGGEP